ncbi:MAG: UDP-N-acetylmuramate--L-alanine ligase [endosymbiont of Galathealinum brachiosum]|uniref:UDP-N-acetylmuramate--L-alanine ligase n=1 Tax=endosymbiont of Galathealinum brachiosum TaxID=2200906 RepID=A0A370D9Y1_9GAMM|nr:MAG: UDP-N-acetylmuramate--L-alanine ligase [endosymbiont of Galathealinum brachiosum]
MRKIQRVHFVGIGGVGMCGIAEVLLNLGYKVSGSDVKKNAAIERLLAQGATVYIGQKASNVKDVEVVVVSTAISTDNVEVVAAKEHRIPVIRRAEMLAEIMRFRHGIAIAGTHGKTTTTSLTASLLIEAGLDPTYVIGGKLNSAATNAKLGEGKYFVAEADESDASFLLLQPMMAVVTNIDADHLETHDGDFDRYKHSFVEFLHHLPFYGKAIICLDDSENKQIMNKISRPVVTYGIESEADVKAVNIKCNGMQCHYDLVLPEVDEVTEITLNMPGKHNVLNSLAAITVAHLLGVGTDKMQKALQEFDGIGRRMQQYGEIETVKGNVLLVDDYGHHPTEIKATLEASKNAWSERRIVVVFQPHRYTRTRDLFEDFSNVLSMADALIVTEIYSAGEEHIAGADGRALCAAIRARGRVNPVFVENLKDLNNSIINIINKGDVLLTLGAGSIGSIAEKLPEALAK